ncbi:MAG: M4 family metallopeptidase, partial [Bacteroidota bacterium]
VAGHEMAHGVIQATANLIYENEPGAMNESFADIFGYLIEGETGDYRIGEDVVTSFFPSGAMRDLRNPNNGATRFGQRGWQPAHMDEFVNLPNTEEGDNGGVHINSGIPNRAFFLFSSNAAVGDARAEEVYYDALNLYLTRSSRFADLRLAVIEASQQFGAAVVAAAENAFAGVGIGGEAGDYTVDLEENEGDRFLLLTNTAETALFLADDQGSLIENPLEVIGLGSRPSVTDDGSVAVFVDDQGQLRVYNFTTGQLNFIEAEPRGTNWRNIAVSKDGERIAVTTTDNDNRILIFDFTSGTGLWFTLTNPTTSTGGLATSDVQYADALEWEPAGQFLMYDALTELDNGRTFWDIGFLRAWSLNDEDFGDGAIFKLPVEVPAGISIGNPTFSKNSPYIIAYEEVDFENETYTIVGTNIETGDNADIFINGVINYPNYDLDDRRLVFDAQTTSDEAILATIPLADNKISAGGDPAIFINGGHWGYFFANGSRDLNTNVLESQVVEDELVKVFPTLSAGTVTIETGVNSLEGPVQVLDMAGRLVYRGDSTAGEQTLELGSLPRGSYFVAVALGQGTVIRRVVLVR